MGSGPRRRFEKTSINEKSQVLNLKISVENCKNITIPIKRKTNGEQISLDIYESSSKSRDFTVTIICTENYLGILPDSYK